MRIELLNLSEKKDKDNLNDNIKLSHNYYAAITGLGISLINDSIYSYLLHKTY